MNIVCPVCEGGALQALREVDGVGYLSCSACGTILAEPSFLERTTAGEARVYDADYWAEELKAARERGYGSSLVRLAEVFFYSRRPIKRFLDVSCGAGTLLDATLELLPEISNVFWGIEPFPPPPEFRSIHPNYTVGFIRDLKGHFDGGTCIEVIEHLPPDVLRKFVGELASVSSPDALWYFNSAQPEFVLRDDPAYLDPFKRGHIASYSVDGLKKLFGEAGFVVHQLPGRDWAFLAEFSGGGGAEVPALEGREWKAHPENLALMRSARFGHLLLTAGLEAAQCYYQRSMSDWAIGELRKQRERVLASWQGIGLVTLR